MEASHSASTCLEAKIRPQNPKGRAVCELAELKLVRTWLEGKQRVSKLLAAACSAALLSLPFSPSHPLSRSLKSGVEPCRITLNKYSKGVGVGVGGEQAPPVEGFPQELLQGQKFTVVSISPFSSQSGNRDCTDPRAAGALTP